MESRHGTALGSEAGSSGEVTRGTEEEMRNRLIALAPVILGASLFLTVAAPVGAASNAYIRVLHASPDAPAVDIYLDGTKVLDDVAFKGISGYLAVPGGSHHIQVYPHGNTTTAVIDVTPSFTAGDSYTVAAINKVASISAAVFQDNVGPMSGKAMLRVIHLSPDTGAVDVALSGQTPADAPVKNLTFPNATGYLTLDPGTYHFEVRPTGTTTVALDLPGVALAAGTNYTVFAVGLSDGAPALGAVVAVDAVLPPATSTSSGSTNQGGSPTLLLAGLALAAAAVTVVALHNRMGTSER